jgi:hypothetical protein
MVDYKEIKKGDHGEPRSEYTAVIGFKNEQLAFVQRYGGEKWGAFLDTPLSPKDYVWFLGDRETREAAEQLMMEAVEKTVLKT